MAQIRRIKLTIEFDGTPFAGWQKQARGASVQGEIERALAAVLGHPVCLIGAGRTDAGVHARAMVAHFDTEHSIPAEKIPMAVITHLPESIAFLAAEQAPASFDARRGAILRWYRYQVRLARRARPLEPRAWRVVQPVDLDRVGEALEALGGEHDFRGFRTTQCTAKRTILTMEEASMRRAGDLLIFDFKCRSFLHRMVRLMTGALVQTGLGRFSPADIRRILSSGERPDAIRSAPAEGLCLMRVAYSAAEARRILTDHPRPPSF